MSKGLRNLLSFQWSVFCKWPVINVTPHIENSSTQTTRLIIYFIEHVVSMNLFEVSMFGLVININCRHLGDALPLISVTYITFYTKLQIMTL